MGSPVGQKNSEKHRVDKRKKSVSDFSTDSTKPTPMTLTEIVDLAKKVSSRQRGKNNAGSGAAAEKKALETFSWSRRPIGKEMINLLAVLHQNRKFIDPTSFDALTTKNGEEINFKSVDALSEIFDSLIFIEIKSGNQERLKEDFTDFFFALTYKEIQAALILEKQHMVVLLNTKPGKENILYTNVTALLERATSMNWQLSIQLGTPGADGESKSSNEADRRELGEDRLEALQPDRVFGTVRDILARRKKSKLQDNTHGIGYANTIKNDGN